MKSNKNKHKKISEKPLTEALRQDIIGAYRRGKSIDEIAGYVKMNPYRILAVIIDDELAMTEKE